MPPTTTTTTISSLTTDLFYDAVKNYIDYNKPDPIAKRQLENWKLDWKNTDRKKIDASIVSGENSFIDCPATNVIQGTLEICGDYVAVTIQMKCVWTNGKKKEDGRLSYQMDVVSAKFIERKNDNEEEEGKAERKIRKKMISRLSQDSYISKIIALSTEEKKSNDNVLCLAQASIYVNTDKFELEERVDVSDTVAETLRRALWSSTKSPLDIVDMILVLPSLPCHNSAAANSSSSTTTSSSSTCTTRLANRAKLRLLEDAMLDECEKEGEDQLIDDLSISPNATTSPDKCKEGKEESTTSSNPKRKKKKSKK